MMQKAKYTEPMRNGTHSLPYAEVRPYNGAPTLFINEIRQA